MISKGDISQMSPLVWAYMGDAVYEKFIREYVIRQGLCKNGLLHKKSIKYVSAKGQSQILKEIEDFRFENRYPSRSAATLELIRLGIDTLKQRKANDSEKNSPQD